MNGLAALSGHLEFAASRPAPAWNQPFCTVGTAGEPDLHSTCSGREEGRGEGEGPQVKALASPPRVVLLRIKGAMGAMGCSKEDSSNDNQN